MIQGISAKYEQQDYDEVTRIKKLTKMTWEEFILAAAKCYEQTYIKEN